MCFECYQKGLKTMEDPVGTLTMGFIAVVWAMVCIRFPHRIAHPFKGKEGNRAELATAVIPPIGWIIAFGGLWLIVSSGWHLLTHTAGSQ